MHVQCERSQIRMAEVVPDSGSSYRCFAFTLALAPVAYRTMAFASRTLADLVCVKAFVVSIFTFLKPY